MNSSNQQPSNQQQDSLQNLVGLGAGGHARVLVELIRKRGGSVHGFLVGDADFSATGEARFEGAPILGTDDLLAELHAQGLRRAFIGLGSVRASRVREKLVGLCDEHGFELPALVDQNALISETVALADGVQVLPGAIINAGATVGRATIINTGAIVEHDCEIGAFAHVSPGSRLGGGVSIGDAAHIGLGACILQGIRIGEDATVGAGAVVIQDVPPGATAVGVPARLL
jgi:UDP-perosamine 4-acetyltransferase